MVKLAVMYIDPETRSRLKQLKGKGKSYDRFLTELMDEKEHRSPSAPTYETGNSDEGASNV